MPKPKGPPYLAFELDALPKSDLAAKSVGLDEGVSARALLRIWEYAWREQVEWVRPEVLAGCCGGNDRLPGALVAFDFLDPVAAGWTSPPVTTEPIPVDGYRIRGARRYLRVGSPQSLGGHAAKGNLIPGGPRAQKSAEPAEAQKPAEPRLTLGRLSADTSADPRHQRAATSDDRTATDQHLAGGVAPAGPAPSEAPGTSEAAQPPRPAEISRPGATSGTSGQDFELSGAQRKRTRQKPPKSDSDPRIRELSDMLVRTYRLATGRDYAFQGAKDGSALVRLVALLSPTMTPDDLDRRFYAGLRSRFGTLTGIADFASRPNDPRWAAPSTRAEDQQHSQTPGEYRG